MNQVLLGAQPFAGVGRGMTYRITGRRGFVVEADSALAAWPKASAASRQFGPITIMGPASEITLEELEHLALQERNATSRPQRHGP